jgi:hypothetical protein
VVGIFAVHFRLSGIQFLHCVWNERKGKEGEGIGRKRLDVKVSNSYTAFPLLLFSFLFPFP